MGNRYAATCRKDSMTIAALLATIRTCGGLKSDQSFIDQPASLVKDPPGGEPRHDLDLKHMDSGTIGIPREEFTKECEGSGMGGSTRGLLHEFDCGVSNDAGRVWIPNASAVWLIFLGLGSVNNHDLSVSLQFLVIKFQH